MTTEPRWRELPLCANSAALNMAIDEAVMESVAAGQSPPTIRFYRWNPSAVSIGYFQQLHEEVDMARVGELGFDVVRRQTGGGAVYHDAQGEITYSLIAPQDLFPKGITESYHVICGRVIRALSYAGISSAFRPINDVVVENRKISGNAQTRRNGVLLQHGTVLFDLDADTMFSVLKVSGQKISDKTITDLKRIVTSVREQAAISRDEWFSCFQKGMCENLSIQTGDLTPSETARANELAKEKYASDSWTAWR